MNNLEKLHTEALRLQVKIYEAWKTKEFGSAEQHKAQRVLIKSRKRSERREGKWIYDFRMNRWNQEFEEDVKIAERNW